MICARTVVVHCVGARSVAARDRTASPRQLAYTLNSYVYWLYVSEESFARQPHRPGMDIGKDLVAASGTPLVLAILREGRSYGYAIIKRVEELSDGELQWTDGMLYPVLHRLERQGFVEADWGKSKTGRRRKYYRLTEHGQRELDRQQRQWEVVDRTLRRTPFLSFEPLPGTA